MGTPQTSSLFAHDYQKGGELIPALRMWRDEEGLSYPQMVFRLHDKFQIDVVRGTLTKWFDILDHDLGVAKAAR